jgi:hypothetical protein
MMPLLISAVPPVNCSRHNESTAHLMVGAPGGYLEDISHFAQREFSVVERKIFRPFAPELHVSAL